jgi:hypothetical protein
LRISGDVLRERVVVDHVFLGAQLLDQLADALDVPGNHRVVLDTRRQPAWLRWLPIRV